MKPQMQPPGGFAAMIAACCDWRLRAVVRTRPGRSSSPPSPPPLGISSSCHVGLIRPRGESQTDSHTLHMPREGS